MIRAILNADDFGISKEVNEAIAMCFDKRYITSTTLMVNMPFAPDAVKMAGEKGFDGRVGLHLNLTAGEPLTARIRSFPVFCSHDGRFNAAFHLSTASRLFLGSRESRALEEEIEAQIKRYLALGLTGMHMDSHHHSHTDLSVWRVAMPLLKKYGFRSVRIGRDIFGAQTAGTFNRLYKGYLNSGIRKGGFKTTDHFGSFADLQGSYEGLEDGCLVEVMLHPMFDGTGELVDTDTPMERVGAFSKEKSLTPEFYQES